MTSSIDVTFSVQTDAGGGDPDRTSPTLKRYHKLLWSKPLPDGREFELQEVPLPGYLHHKSDSVGEFFLSSDSVIHTFRHWKRMAPIIEQVPKGEMDRFYDLAYTIGAMLVFPGDKIDGKMTINGARGLDRRICDRLDLTLECIRRHYLGEASPLSETLDRYGQFFELFGDFGGYTDFFLLQDLVDGSDVAFFTDDFDDFTSMLLPRDISTYGTYMERSLAFVNARNDRILAWANTSLELGELG